MYRQFIGIVASNFGGENLENNEYEKMIRDNDKLVYHIISRRFPSLTQDEDVVQAGMIGLWKACRDYDPSKGAFSTCVCAYIIHEIHKELEMRNEYQKFGAVQSLNEIVENPDGSSDMQELINFIPDKPDDVSGREYDFSALRSKFSSRDNGIFMLRAQDYTYEEIARIYGLSKQRVDQIIRKMRKYFLRKDSMAAPCGGAL